MSASPTRPLVSVICAAYNYARYLPRAVESVLSQPGGSERLELIVVDDGSTDDTPEVIKPYLSDPRLRYVRKENGGFPSTVTRGLEEARGRYLCFCDADDEWPANRLDAQLAVLESSPQVGLVYSDMEVIDEQGQLLHPSFMQGSGFATPSGNLLDVLTENNFISGGSLMVRAALKDRFVPIPPAAAGCPDWWTAYRVAQIAEIRWVPGSVLRYRQHTSNMTLARQGDRSFNVLATLEFRRLTLSAPEADQVGLPSLLQSAAQLISTPLEARQMVPVTDSDREQGRRLQEQALELEQQRDYERALRTLVRAAAADPTAERSEIAHRMATALEARRQALAGNDLKAFRVAADAAELIEEPTLLADYADTFSAGDDLTLIVNVASDHELEQLSDAADQVGLDADVLALEVSAQELNAAADALYSRRAPAGPLAALPRFESAVALQQYASSR